ncbi:type I-B CRISPR-associated protein Cas8b1/Cst1, partial [Thermococci archaeon]
MSEYIYRFTGNPFVDAGIAALCAITKKNDPKAITKDDLRESINFISNHYPNWRKLGN